MSPKLGFLPFSQVWFIIFPVVWIWWWLGTRSNYQYKLNQLKNLRAQIWAKWTKIGFKIRYFSHFIKFDSLVFLEIAYDNSLKHFLSTSRGKTYEKNFGGPKLGPKLGCLPFSQGCIISFPWYCTRLQLGTMPNV